MKNLKRRIVWDKGGVSEVIGTILTLSITVVLFSSIIVMVNHFPAPGDSVYTDFTANIEYDSNITLIRITNVGGQVMTHDWTLIAVSIDSYTFSLRTKGTLDNRTYGIGPGVPGYKGDGNGDKNWDTGECWIFPRNETEISRTSDVSAMILDQGRNALVWSGQIRGARNRFGPVISDIWVDSDIESLRPDPVQFGRPFYIFAEVYDPDGDLDVNSVYADLSSITISNIIPMYHMGSGLFRSQALMGPNVGDVPIGFHIALVNASDESGMHSRASGRISVGMDLKGQPNLVINDRNLAISQSTPTNHQIVTFTITVVNYGGWCNGTLTLFDVLDPVTDPVGTPIHEPMNFTISDGPDQITRIIRWRATPGGPHTIRVLAEPVNALDADPSDNEGFINITVLPTILLVDDDNHPSDFSERDTVSYMRGALDSCDFRYDLYTVGTAMTGPGYDYGERAMKNYDVVIWMTGYQSTHTLTAGDRANITSYLTGAGRAGSLWLIGQYLLDDPSIPFSFFESSIKVEDRALSVDGPGAGITGVDGNPVSDEWSNETIPVTTRLAGHGGGWRVRPNSEAQATFNQGTEIPVPWGDALNYENALLDSRVVFFPWEYSRITSTSDQAKVAYRVLNWLGNLPSRHGDDLAVSQQILDPSFVFYNQEVTVTATIRNNGPNNLTTQVGLFLDGGNEPIEWVESLDVPGDGGTASVTGQWLAKSLGTHVLKWVVDPNNLIPETNEGNNEVPSYIHTGEVFVEFRILVVDDDSSANNNGTMSNDTAEVTASLSRLGYLYDSHNGNDTAFVVMDNGNGPDIEYMKNYSAVLWVTGDSIAGITGRDANTIENYTLNYNGRLWLSGNDLFSGLPPANRSRLLNALGIADAIADQPISGLLRGADNSPISHGMNISIADNPFADMLVPATASGTFYQSYPGAFCAVAYGQGNYHAFTSGFDVATLHGAATGHITGEDAIDELVYMLLRWTGRPETRNELRITERDYFISDRHPQLGSAYILRATVHNVGAGEANLLVRFMDGSVQIGSDTISISPGTSTSAEIIWRPLFAGSRNIRILADPLGDVDEIFPWFNNNYTFSIYVYFFWDDMESGAGKWTHSATILNINGEGPLDFLTAGYTNVNTDVVGAWDWSRSSGVQNSTKFSNSYPNSFFMEEPTGAFGAKSDVLVGIAIDNSPSMVDRICPDGRTFLRVAKDGAIAMVNSFSNASAVGVWYFKGANEWPLISITPLAGAGRQTVIDAIESIKEEQGNTNTAIWDTIGGAYMDVHNAIPLYPDNYAAVVSLGDGGDYQAADSSATKIQSIEAGSDEWAPWGNMYPELGYPTSNYPNHWGKYWFYHDETLPGAWVNAGTHGGAWKPNRKGLLNSDIPIYTIGLALEHYDPPNGNPVAAQPAEGVKDTYTHVLNTESGTIEYNFWRIANTSGAQYFYSEDGSNLELIFETIGQIIGSSGFNQTRSSAPAPGTRAANVDKKAVSPAFDLTQYESAKMSFWTMYNMLSGGNGGVVGVELWEPAESAWKFMYIIPPGAYTGGLYYEYDTYDDFGNPINWCFNGISGRNTFGWDYISVDILPFIRAQGLANHSNADYYTGNARLAFKYIQYGGGTGVGWFLDDVRLEVSRAAGAAINANTKDIWQLDTAQAHSGSHAWSNYDPATSFLRTGIDNSLMTMPIDLTNAREAYLSGYFKFNINEAPGTPPDGFRVEISTDGGATWRTLNLGIRAAWGVSGTGSDADDGVWDGKAYTGLTDSGNPAGDGYWVSALSLSRLNVDLTSFSGHQVIIRFRMVVNNLPAATYPHNNNAVHDPGFGGWFIDDVNVYGETIIG